MTKSFALTLAYDGTRYAGWQTQPNGVAIQQIVTDAVATVVGHPVVIRGSGRTDAGVHAQGQVASFQSDVWAPPAHRLVQAINGVLPRDIAVLDARRAVDEFDPIRNATGKRYQYIIRTSRVPDPLRHSHQWWLPKALDVDKMRRGAERLLGKHDFKAFESLGSRRKTSVRTVRDLVILEQSALAGRELVIEIEADGFLYNMVRNIVGALVAIGKDRFPPEWLDSVLASRDRITESPTAPARGLCLISVSYPDRLFLDDA